jgi:hypothetical protein
VQPAECGLQGAKALNASASDEAMQLQLISESALGLELRHDVLIVARHLMQMQATGRKRSMESQGVKEYRLLTLSDPSIA